MLDYFKRRKARKQAREILRHSRHLRRMRDDLMNSSEKDKLLSREAKLRESLAADTDTIRSAGDDLVHQIVALTPRRSAPWLRENLEVIVVAVAVAMAFRTYFIQPFKIPTGSMQPTLFGITALDKSEPELTDRVPLRYIKWFITGELYREVTVRKSGTLGMVRDGRGAAYVSSQYPGDFYYQVADVKYRIPRTSCDQYMNEHGAMDFKIRSSGYRPGDYVQAGSVLWAGSRKAGDHVFVDKVSWNFRKPRRGEIMVFATTGITDLEKSLGVDRHGKPLSTHYIKRMCGLPGEKIAIDPPRLLIDDRSQAFDRAIQRIIDRQPGYAGYQDMGRYSHIQLDEDQYFAMGDNTRNSRDSRYWGPVPRSNLVGPALMIYWPFISDRLPTGRGDYAWQFGLKERNGWQFGVPR